MKTLKLNYERLIAINKKLTEQTKDKEFALDIQAEELKRGYESIKQENVKLKDDLETQSKLWKIWLQNFDANEDNENPQKKNDSVQNSQDDEILLIEDDDEATDEIFSRYMESIKNKSGFQRTSPVSEAIYRNTKKEVFKCTK